MDDPLRVRVIGRSGAGRRTVARALHGAGLTVTDSAADVDVYVGVETLNADDRAALAASARPTVAVLNKTDLAGFGAGARVSDRCWQLRRETGVPVRPFSALLALAGTDPAVLDGTVGALRMLASGAAPDVAARGRLAADLDVFGTALAVAALRGGAPPSTIAELLSSVSGISGVLTEIDRAGAAHRYRRAAGPHRVTAARAVLEAAGVPAPTGDHVRRAVHWYRYARGPVSPLHRACALDNARGALRLWTKAGGRPGVMP